MFESINQFKNELSIEKHNLQLTPKGFRPIHRAIFDELKERNFFFNKEEFANQILEFKDKERTLDSMKEKIELLESTFDINLEEMGLFEEFIKVIREDDRGIFFMCFEGEFFIDSQIEILFKKLINSYNKEINKDLYYFILKSFLRSFERVCDREVINLSLFCKDFIHMAKLYKKRKSPKKDELEFYNGLMDFGHWIISKHDNFNKLVA